MTEIAREAKVSLPLVSRFLNNDETLRITDKKRERIERATKKLGGLRTRRTVKTPRRNLVHSFSVPVNSCFSYSWFQENIAGAEEFKAFTQTLRARDFLASVNFFEPDECLGFLKSISLSHCDGFLLGNRMVDEGIARWLLENRIPHVSTDPRDDRWGINTVYDHAISGLRQAVEHLLDLGHRRIGFVGSPTHYPQFILAMAEKEISFADEDRCHVDYVTPSEDFSRYREHAREAFSQWFRPGQGPTAVICRNDYIALGIIDVLRDRGLEPGTDLSVIGYNNNEQRDAKSTKSPFLTTVDVPFDKIGQRCAERLLDQALHGQCNITHEQIPVKLVVRKTTGICRVGK